MQNACIHTRSERLSSHISTYENNTTLTSGQNMNSRVLLKIFRFPVANRFLWRDGKSSMHAFHTRCERLSSPISTYGNSTDTHFRSKYECSSLAKKLDCASRTGFCGAIQNYQHMHATRDVVMRARLFSSMVTIQTLTPGQNMGVWASWNNLGCALRMGFCGVVQ